MVEMVAVGARFQKASPSKKIYRVIAAVSRDYQPPHVQFSAENDSSQVITVAASSLFDQRFWKPVD